MSRFSQSRSLKPASPPGWPIVDLAQSELGTHFIYPDIRTPRFVLPLNRRARRAGLSFFIPPTSRVLLCLRWLWRISSTFYKVVRLSETRVMETIKTLGGIAGIETVIKLGTPGPHTKNTILLLDPLQVPRAIVKMGNTEQATLLLKNEAHWLKAISSNNYLLNQCPALLKEQQLDEAYFIVQSAGIGKFSDYALSDSHIDFLSIFQAAFHQEQSYYQSKMHRDMYRRYSLLRNKLSQGWANRSQEALSTIEHGLRGAQLTLPAAHRDFAPWNIRLTERGLFVFDWEYASEGYLPMYDLFHFLLMPVAVRNDIPLTQVRAILRTVRKYGNRLPDGVKQTESIDLQLLAYLLDLSLMYLESRKGKDLGYVVLCRYAELIDSFDRWRTA